MKNSSLFDALLATGHWGEIEAELGIEFDFKCAYCAKDLLSSVDYYKEWQTEHIVPASKGGADDVGNYALTCRTCNFIKGVWSPEEHCKQENPTKYDLIKIAKKYIESKRLATESDINLYRTLIREHS